MMRAFAPRLRFSVRQMCIGLVVLAVPLAFIAHALHQLRTQRSVEAELERRGAFFGHARQLDYDLSPQTQAVVFPDLFDESAAELVTDLPRIDSVAAFGRTESTHAVLSHLASISQLQQLTMRGVNSIDDDDCAVIATMQSLKTLNLSSDRITDLGIERLARIPGLESLELSCPQITDESLRSIARLASLESLFISRAGITDAGLEHLGRTKSLRRLILENARISKAGVDDLTAELPACRVDWAPQE